jgi:phosphate transport system substrate-binding protein
MIRRSMLRLGAPLMVAVAIAGACSSSSSKTTTPPAGSSGTTTVSLAPATLQGSGSTLQASYEDAAIQAFTDKNKGITINYNSVGSGQGQTDLEGQITQFGGSDVPVSAADVSKFKGGPILYFPIVAGPITIPYKLSGVDKLQLSGDTLGKIFARTVKTWNDPAIAADNPGVKLPSTAITVVHRSDSSGTTANFTEFLKKAGGAAWTLGTGKVVTWSTDTQAGKGSAGVITIVSKTDGAIGYVDFSDAKGASLSFASVKNANGKYVAPSLDAASAAVAAATPAANLVYDPIDVAGDAVYPITSPTYVITYVTQPDPAKAAALKAYLTFVLGSDGQALAKDNDYAPLSTDLASKASAQVAMITGG